MSMQPTFADITTIQVGGSIAHFIEPTSRVAVIEAVEEADSKGLPLCVIGGGSNMLVSDEPFDGVVVRDARRAICVPDEASPAQDGVDPLTGEHVVHVSAEAGCNWDDFVRHTIKLGLAGAEGLSGIPGTVGASVVQNIGAYGQEVSQLVESVEVWDRQEKKTAYMPLDVLHFGYRTSIFKQSMYRAPGVPADMFFPTPRYVVLSVTFRLRHSKTGVVAHSQLAHALGVDNGAHMDTSVIRREVLRVRASKGMLEDASRYLNPWMQSVKNQEALLEAADLQEEDYRVGALLPSDNPYSDRHSCGSFFMNPVLSLQESQRLPEDAPRFDAHCADGSRGVKTSAAWLIDHAGFARSFRLNVDGKPAQAAVSSLHTLALTNRGGARANDIVALADHIADGVEACYGVRLIPEPVLIGMVHA